MGRDGTSLSAAASPRCCGPEPAPLACLAHVLPHFQIRVHGPRVEVLYEQRHVARNDLRRGCDELVDASDGERADARPIVLRVREAHSRRWSRDGTPPRAESSRPSTTAHLEELDHARKQLVRNRIAAARIDELLPVVLAHLLKRPKRTLTLIVVGAAPAPSRPALRPRELARRKLQSRHATPRHAELRAFQSYAARPE